MQTPAQINHFRNHYELTRKDHMVKNLKRMVSNLRREDKAAEVSQQPKREIEQSPASHIHEDTHVDNGKFHKVSNRMTYSRAREDKAAEVHEQP